MVWKTQVLDTGCLQEDGPLFCHYGLRRGRWVQTDAGRLVHLVMTSSSSHKRLLFFLCEVDQSFADN